MAILRNKYSHGVVAANVAVADNFWTRFRGLMFRSPLAVGDGLAFSPAGTIHMMFMRFPIDAVFCDHDGRVTKVARDVRPWIGGAVAPRKTRLLIELPAGALTSSALATNSNSSLRRSPDSHRSPHDRAAYCVSDVEGGVVDKVGFREPSPRFRLTRHCRSPRDSPVLFRARPQSALLPP